MAGSSRGVAPNPDVALRRPVDLRRNGSGEVVLLEDLRELGLTSNLAMAKYLDCGEGTISRIANDEHNPGLDLIAKVAKAFPDQPLSRYFVSPYFEFAPKGAEMAEVAR